MAEFSFYGTIEDQLEFLRDLTRIEGLGLLPCLGSPGPRPKHFRSVTPELLRILSVNKGLYISGPFTKRVFTEKVGRGYSIQFRKGGPLIYLSLPYCVKEKGIWRLGGGDIQYLPDYLNEDETGLIKASEELKDYFGRIKKLICTHTVKRRVEKNIRIGGEADRLFIEGRAWAMDCGLWYRWDGAKVVVAAAGPNRRIGSALATAGGRADK